LASAIRVLVIMRGHLVVLDTNRLAGITGGSHTVEKSDALPFPAARMDDPADSGSGGSAAVRGFG
jgi:hypothetical protein